MRINIDKIAASVMENMEIYLANTIADVKHAVDVVARETVEELRETSPIGSTGDYAKSWAHRLHPDRGKDYHARVVYSKKPDYRITHLLEKGHDTANGNWVDPRPHIAAAEAKAEVWMTDMLTRNIRG